MNGSLAELSEISLPKRIGQALRYIRESRGLDQGELAKHGHVNKRYISELESGRYEPKFSSIYKYLRAAGADWSDFAEEMGWL